MHTRHTGLLHTWTIPLVGKHYVRVFIWDTLERLRYHEGEGSDARAFARMMRYAENEQETRLPRKFGEVHFYAGGMGAGIVAHELTHILLYWVIANQLDADEHDEEICQRMEGMTREFWIKFYELEEHDT